MSLVIVEQCLMEGSSEDADATATAMATVRALRLLLNALKPLVGSSAACALCRRSVLVATSLIPRALADVQIESELLASVHRHLALLSSVGAKRESRALQDTFADLLASLIGNFLTNQLLEKAWALAEGQPGHAQAALGDSPG